GVRTVRVRGRGVGGFMRFTVRPADMQIFVETLVDDNGNTCLLKSLNISGVVLMNVRDERVLHGLWRHRLNLREKIGIKLLTQVFRVNEQDALIRHANRRVSTTVYNHINARLDLFDGLGRRCLLAARALGALGTPCVTATLRIAARSLSVATAAFATGRPLPARRGLLTLRSLCDRNERWRRQRDSYRKRDRDRFFFRHWSS